MEAASAGSQEVDAAVRAARACLHSDSWGKSTSGRHRAKILRKMGSLLEEQSEEFAILESMDNGKPLHESRGDIQMCIAYLEYYAGLAEQLDLEGNHAANGTVRLSLSDEAVTGKLRREPVGVIGAITPWNFPLYQAVLKVAPAMAAGCTMVLKPSEICPATCLRLGDLVIEAGLPAGALNILNGYGHEAGQALLDHPKIDRLSFTGSGRTGHLVLEAASKRLIPASVELGGKSAIVVFDDVDIDVVVDWIMCGIFICSGQVCSATSRLIVQDSIYERLMARLVEETKKIKVGDPFSKDTNIGPLVSEQQLSMVVGFVDRAKAEGVRVVHGGRHKESNGYFYEPTILDDLCDDSEAWQQEIFGPVLAVRQFSTEEEAISMANNTPYGLGHAVCTGDDARSLRVAEKLDAGVVWQNCSNVLSPEIPFGGFKESGFGKEGGELALEEYLKVKAIVRTAPGYSLNHFVKK